MKTAGPREKLFSHGVQSLSDAELFALVIGTGRPGTPALQLAQELLDHFGTTASILGAPWEEIQHSPGIGAARFGLFQAVRELARRASTETLRTRPLLDCPEHVRAFLADQLGGLGHEIFGALFLDTRHRLIRFERLFQGSLTATYVYPREVARRALQLNAKSVIAVHNHPSGEARPSTADQLLTSQLRRSLATLEIDLLDHLIVAGGCTVSADGV